MSCEPFATFIQRSYVTVLDAVSELIFLAIIWAISSNRFDSDVKIKRAVEKPGTRLINSRTFQETAIQFISLTVTDYYGILTAQ